MAIPDSSLMKGASMMTIFCDVSTISTVITGKNGIDLLRKLKHKSHESITHSNLKMFFIPMTKSTLSWILETKVKILNLSPYKSQNDKAKQRKHNVVLSHRQLNDLEVTQLETITLTLAHTKKCIVHSSTSQLYTAQCHTAFETERGKKRNN